MTKKVFLGGTWNKLNDWRESIISQLHINYFNPIVENWTTDSIKEENRQKEICDFLLYVITKEMKGVYSIAEVVDDSNKRPEKTIFCYLEDGFDEAQIKSLRATAELVKSNGANVFNSFIDVVNYLNNTQVQEVKVEWENLMLKLSDKRIVENYFSIQGELEKAKEVKGKGCRIKEKNLKQELETLKSKLLIEFTKEEFKRIEKLWKEQTEQIQNQVLELSKK